MAKQTFTTGQVLTAAQMTSLQQTAMGGGSPSTKTASYVLTAADAGTVIQMNSASATTITVNTSLFAAGDSVQIQNIGAGVCTITAGTATVNSAGTLGVTQYDGGFLYFSSDSSAIWFDFTQAGTALPLTTKGDLFGYSTTNARVPIGTNGQVLTADSAEALGLKWASPAGGGKVLQVVQGTTNTATVIASTSMTDTALTVTITPTSATSKVLIIVSQQLKFFRSATAVGAAWRLMRGATEVFKGYNDNNDAFALSNTQSETLYNGYWPLNYLDSPATTSATTYKTQARIASTANSGAVTAQVGSTVSSIIALEIGA